MNKSTTILTLGQLRRHPSINSMHSEMGSRQHASFPTTSLYEGNTVQCQIISLKCWVNQFSEVSDIKIKNMDCWSLAHPHCSCTAGFQLSQQQCLENEIACLLLEHSPWRTTEMQVFLRGGETQNIPSLFVRNSEALPPPIKFFWSWWQQGGFPSHACMFSINNNNSLLLTPSNSVRTLT